MYRLREFSSLSLHALMFLLPTLVILNIVLAYIVTGDWLGAIVIGAIIGVLGSIIISYKEGIIFGIIAWVVVSIVALILVSVLYSPVLSEHTFTLIIAFVVELIFCIVGSIIGNLTRSSGLGVIVTPV